MPVDFHQWLIHILVWAGLDCTSLGLKAGMDTKEVIHTLERIQNTVLISINTAAHSTGEEEAEDENITGNQRGQETPQDHTAI